MTGDGLTAINAFLYTRLAARAALTAEVADRIREQPRLLGGALPYVSWRHVDPGQATYNGGLIALVTSELICYALALATDGDVDLMVAELDAALHEAEGDAEGWRVAVQRLRPHREPHVEDGGRVVIEAGGAYRAIAYRT